MALTNFSKPGAQVIVARGGRVQARIECHSTAQRSNLMAPTNFPKPGAQVIVARGGRVQARIECDTSTALADTAFWTHT
jgi:antitoxin (DNA-binding transcriptional repressor) of toxin-antitoxin stability system